MKKISLTRILAISVLIMVSSVGGVFSSGDLISEVFDSCMLSMKNEVYCTCITTEFRSKEAIKHETLVRLAKEFTTNLNEATGVSGDEMKREHSAEFDSLGEAYVTCLNRMLEQS